MENEQQASFDLEKVRNKVLEVIGEELADHGAPDHREMVSYIDALILESIVDNEKFAVYGATCAVQAITAILKCFGVSTKNDTNEIHIGFSGRLPGHTMAFETAKAVLPLLNTLNKRQMGPSFGISLDGQSYRPREN